VVVTTLVVGQLWSDLRTSLLFYLLPLLTCTSTYCALCHLSDYGYILLYIGQRRTSVLRWTVFVCG